jgi:single-stranded-DNA-specific exonuclease
MGIEATTRTVSRTYKRWLLREKLPEEHFVRFPGVPRLIVQILHNRGIQEPDQVRHFLERTAPGDTNPFQLKGMSEAVARLRSAILAGELIAIFGDYDADGVTAAALLTQVLSALGARLRPSPYIPDRVEEGYGLNNNALAALAEEGVRLVVTVDCGIRSVDEAAYAADQLGLDLIITDHHTVGPQMPRAVAVINPKQPGCVYPFKQLAGVGLAYKLAQALLRTTDPPLTLGEDDLVDLVALGTVADVSPLVDENRALVVHGLERLNTAPRLGIKALMGQADLKPGAVNSWKIGFALAPRLNAAGRLESAKAAYELLVTDDAARAADLARQLDNQNRERQERTLVAVEKARQFIQADRVSSLLYLITDPSFGEGIVGLVAGRLTEEFYRPVLVAHLGEAITKGSARSIPELHITRALDECKDLLERHGGHSAAAGFTVTNANLLALYTRLLEIAARELADKTLDPALEIDAEINLRGIDRRREEDILTARAAGRHVDSANGGAQIIDGLSSLEPCGSGNPMPVFATYGLEVRQKQQVGADCRHLRLKLHDGLQGWDAIAFGQAGLCDRIGARVDIAYRLEANDWNNREGSRRRTLQLVVQDIRMGDPRSG